MSWYLLDTNLKMKYLKIVSLVIVALSIPSFLTAIDYTDCSTSISGRIYEDNTFGDTNYPTSTTLGNPIGTGETLYAYAIHDADNLIVAKTTVAADGSYTLTGGMSDGIGYDVIVTIADADIGESEPFRQPVQGYNYSAERDDSGSISDPGDGNVDVSSSSGGAVTNIDFWMVAQSYNVSGTVYQDDTDDSTVNGTGTNAGGLFAYLVQDNFNIIYYKTTVAANGTFSFMADAGQYDVYITSYDLNIGVNEPDSPTTLPNDWQHIGANDPDDGSFQTNGGVVDLFYLSGNVSNVDFGIRYNYTPDVNIFAVLATCSSGMANDDASINFQSVDVATHYNYTIGTTYSGPTDLASATSIDPSTDLPVLISPLTNPSGSRDYTFRIFNGSDSEFVDVTVTLYEQACTGAGGTAGGSSGNICGCLAIAGQGNNGSSSPNNGSIYSFDPLNPSPVTTLEDGTVAADILASSRGIGIKDRVDIETMAYNPDDGLFYFIVPHERASDLERMMDLWSWHPDTDVLTFINPVGIDNDGDNDNTNNSLSAFRLDGNLGDGYDIQDADGMTYAYGVDGNDYPECAGGCFWATIRYSYLGDYLILLTANGEVVENAFDSNKYVTMAGSSTLRDAEQDASSIYLNDNTIELLNNGTSLQEVGLSFANIAIPRGATITKAYIQFSTPGPGANHDADPIQVTISGEASDDAEAFSATPPDDVFSRVQTTANVQWNIPTWGEADKAGADQQTPDLSAIVQEIVNRPGWTINNEDLAFIIHSPVGSGSRTVKSFDDGDHVTSLHIEYENNRKSDYVVPQYSCCPGAIDIDDIAASPTTGEVYAVINSGVEGELQYIARLNPFTGEILETYDIYFDYNGDGTQGNGDEQLEDVEGLSFTSFGQLILSTGANNSTDLDNSIFLFDLSTGNITPLGRVGLPDNPSSQEEANLPTDLEALSCAGLKEIIQCTPPTITLGANPIVGQGITTADLTYSATTEDPDNYTLDFDATAEAAGFVDVINQGLPTSPISMVVPASAPIGVYNATLVVRNTLTGCNSQVYTITIEVSCQMPTATAAITDATCSGSTINSDGTITLSGFTTEKYDVVTGSSYTGSATYATATAIPAGGVIDNTLANPSTSQDYTIRIFNSAGCVVDRTVLLQEVSCSCTNPIITSLTNESILEGNSFTNSNITTSVTNGISVTYQWYNDNGTDNLGTAAIAGQTTATLTALPTATGVYQYKVVVTNTMDNSCMAEESVTLSIMPNCTIGTTCDDNNPNTTNDVIISSDCTCLGIAPDLPCAYPMDAALQLNTIAGGIWLDWNKDGVKDNRETDVFSNIRVQLLDNNNKLLETSHSDYNGVFSFDLSGYNNPTDEVYKLAFKLPTDVRFIYHTYSETNGVIVLDQIQLGTCTNLSLFSAD